MIRENSALSTYDIIGVGGGIYCDQGSAMVIIGSEISRNSAPHGAGIYCYGATSFFISDCNIHDNVADAKTDDPAGGGICYVSPPSAYGSTFLVTNSSISNNIVRGTACKGGGLCCLIQSNSYTPIIISGCVIAGNSAQAKQNDIYNNGGGIYVAAYGSSSQILLSETEVKENSAIQGGGIHNIGGNLNLSRCRISGNSAILGSAIECLSGETVIENSVISGNRSLRMLSECSVIQCISNPLLKIANCTIIGNVSPVIDSPANPMTSITNSIIYRNSPDPRNHNVLPPNYFSISYSDIQGGYAGTGNIDADPCFAISGHWDSNGTPIPYDDFWVEGDYRLTAASPCIDSGTYTPLSDNKDLAGKPRVIGAAIDIGAYENNNTQPVAEAGPDQIVYAWIDGNAAVILDGSNSHDPDGDKLSYLWNWMVGGSSSETNGVSPTIKLPVGKYKIELIVNDMLADSQPDDVNITVVGPVESQLWVIPFAINRQCGQPNILAMLKLPAGITKEQIDSEYKLLLYPGGIEAKMQYFTQCWDNGSGRIGIVASFDRSTFLSSVSANGANGNVTLYVVGRLTTGQYFFGRNMVWITNPPPIFSLPKCDK